MAITYSLQRKIVHSIFIMGFSGFVAQMLLLRELMVTFMGNELTIGIILANWLLLESLGAVIAGTYIDRSSKKLNTFVLIQLLFSFMVFLSVYAARMIRPLFGYGTGEALGFGAVFGISFLILMPVSILHGSLFSCSCSLYSTYAGENETDSAKAGRVYIREMIGTIAAGILFTFLLIPHFKGMHIAFIVIILNVLACGLLLLRSPEERSLPFGILSWGLTISCTFLLIGSAADAIHWYTVHRQWEGQQVLFSENSIYGNITVTQLGNEYTFFTDGLPVITTPHPDIQSIEAFAHLPMLHHPHPEDVLILGSGAGGLIGEVLKHPVKHIDYAELDPLLITALHEFPTELTAQELTDSRVQTTAADGRRFVSQTEKKYDVIFIGMPYPQDLQTNRLFTLEFFSLLNKRLNDDGLVVLRLPGSMSYLSSEIKNLNALGLNTLKEVFPFVKTIPGDDRNIHLASHNPEISEAGAEELVLQWEGRDLDTRMITEGYITYRLDQRRLDWFLDGMEGSTQRINRDFTPTGVFYGLSYWNAMYSPPLYTVFRQFSGMNMYYIYPVLAGAAAIGIFLVRRKPKVSRQTIPISVGATGFAGMLFDLALIYAFQALYGYVYSWIGVLLAAFMGGAACGGRFMISRLLATGKQTFAAVEAAVVAMSLLLAGAAAGLFPHFHPGDMDWLVQAVFLTLSFLSGCCLGMQYPLANKLYRSSSPQVSKTAGILYGSDLFGGWVAGMLSGVLLLPFMGLVGICFLAGAVKLCSGGMYISAMRYITV